MLQGFWERLRAGRTTGDDVGLALVVSGVPIDLAIEITRLAEEMAAVSSPGRPRG